MFRIFICSSLFLLLLSSCGLGNCDIEDIDFIGDWTVNNATYSESVSSVQAENRRDFQFSPTDAESFVMMSIGTMELNFLSKDTVIWTTPRNTLTINYVLSRKYSEFNLRTGYTHHKIDVKDCDHFSLTEDNLALGYTAKWLFERKQPKKEKH